MAEPHYEHPGEVREAKNFQCLHCGKVFTTPQGLCGHLYRLHAIKAQDIQYQRDWEITNGIADDNEPSPAINRTISTFSGDKKMKSKQEMTHNLECIVEGCGKVYGSSAGVSNHQTRNHGQGSKIDVNWRWTKKPITYSDKRALAIQAKKGIESPDITERHIDRPSPKRKYTRKPLAADRVVVTPNSKFVDIPVVIRVPISIGEAEILQELEELDPSVV